MAAMKKSRISRLEARLENFIEGLFVGRLKAEAIMPAITRAFDEHIRFDTAGNRIVPTRFLVSLSPNDYQLLLNESPDAAEQVKNLVLSLAEQAGARVNQPIRVSFAPVENQARGSIAVDATWPNDKSSQTRPMQAVHLAQYDAPPGAQLLREGRKVMDLDRHVVNIGRRMDNNLVLDDSRVSRLHCQLRLRHGKYVVFDLNSSHGTLVNGVQVVEHTLQSGDVLSIGGIQLIYIDDTPTDALENLNHDTATKPRLDAPNEPLVP